jgi:hypothetical protein
MKLQDSDVINFNEKIHFTIFFILLIFTTTISIIINKDKKNALKLVLNKYFILSFIFVIVSSYIALFGLYDIKTMTDEDYVNHKKIRTATIHALAAYIITIFHKLDAIAFSPFVLVWILAYFLHIE